jgi:hypothetical protein
MRNRAAYSVFSRKWDEENHERLDQGSRSANRNKILGTFEMRSSSVTHYTFGTILVGKIIKKQSNLIYLK